MNMTDPRITETELTGGDSPIVAAYCLNCHTEIPRGNVMCEACWIDRDDYLEAIAEDDELFKDKENERNKKRNESQVLQGMARIPQKIKEVVTQGSGYARKV